MSEQLMNLRQQALNVMAFEHADDPEMIALREKAQKVNKEIEKYLEQYIPDRLQYKDKQEIG
jgi:hypothetical protein